MSVDILVLFINCFLELMESLSNNSYISVFGQFLKGYHVPLIESHILVSSYVLYLCIRIHIFKKKTQKTKTATSPCTYGLPLYREISSPNRPVRDSVSLSNLPCECAFFWTCKCKFPVRWICCLLFFQELLIFIPCLLRHVCSDTGSLELPQTTRVSCFPCT